MGKIKNIIKNVNSNKIIPFCIAMLSFIILNTIIVVELYHKEEVKEDIFRLHVVANSNDIIDQIVKLKVATKVETYIDEITSVDMSKDEIKSILESNVDDILAISNDVLREDDFPYDTTIKLGKINYDEKISVNETMPKGTYDSIQIVLGNGNGKNFWTLISPSEKNIKKIKEFKTILPGIEKIYEENNEETNVKYSSKVFELFERLKIKLEL